MRARTVFIILLVLILLVAFGPALVAVISQTIAEWFGCQVDLNRVIPCVIGGKDYGQTFYDLGFPIWYSYLSLPAGAVLFARVAGRGDHHLRRRPDATPIRNAVDSSHAEDPRHTLPRRERGPRRQGRQVRRSPRRGRSGRGGRGL